MERIRHVTVRASLVLAAFLTGPGTPGIAGAQTDAYPVKPVRMIVPFPPGGSTDLNARLISARFSEVLGQQVIVDNRSGASGTIGTELAARSAPDGYIILLHTVPFVTSPIVYGRAPYDPLNDFAPISLLSSVPMAIAVHPSVPVHSVRELLALAKARPGALNYGSAGIGTNSHITGELFNLLGKTAIVPVHFKGGGPALVAAVSGEVHVSFSNVSETARMVAANRLRPLAISSPQRSPVLPGVPSNTEVGLPGFEFQAWHGLLAPRGTPPAIVALLNEKLRGAVSSPEQKKRFEERGLDVVTNSPEEFATYLKNEVTKWGRVIRERNIKPE